MSRIAEEVGFVHLRVHSAYSLLEGALHIKKLADLAAADRMPALALTDTGNLFGALECAGKMVEKGIQPIVGCQLAFDLGEGGEGDRFAAAAGAPHQKPLFDLVLLALTEPGYWNLVRLVSESFMRTATGDRPHLPLEALADHASGLVALTGGPRGPVDRAIAGGQAGGAALRLDRRAEPFGDPLYVELPRHGPPSRLPKGPAACRHQRAVLPEARRLRGP